MTFTVVASLSGGKDSLDMLLRVVRRFGADRVVAHYQVIPEDWDETLEFNQDACRQLGIRLVAQQVIYEPKPGTEHGIRRLEIRDIQSAADIVQPGSGAIASLTDLAYRREWPPSPASRLCTSSFKRDLLDAWIRQNQAWLGSTIIVALGERAAESRRRAGKARIWPRIGTKHWQAWNWLPVHNASRREIFRHLRDHGFDPHPAYRHQGMTPEQMYDKDEEGGPRCGCVACIFASHADVCHQASVASNREILYRIAQFEAATGRTWWSRTSATDILMQLGLGAGGPLSAQALTPPTHSPAPTGATTLK